MTDTTTAGPAGAGGRIEADRGAIDALDGRIIELLTERAEVSARIQRTRVGSGGPRTVFAREMDILARYRDGLGADGTRIAMDVLKLCRGEPVIRHVVLFKFKSGVDWQDPRARAAEHTAAQVGREVPELREWRYGRNVSPREIAYDFLVEGLLDDMDKVDRYLVHPYHQQAIQQWREISDWVVVDVEV